jgi:hypothetical protein
VGRQSAIERGRAANVRFIVQAVNGVGLVSLSANQGEYYVPGVRQAWDCRLI